MLLSKSASKAIRQSVALYAKVTGVTRNQAWEIIRPEIQIRLIQEMDRTALPPERMQRLSEHYTPSIGVKAR